jgi:hypothetical protein
VKDGQLNDAQVLIPLAFSISKLCKNFLTFRLAQAKK